MAKLRHQPHAVPPPQASVPRILSQHSKVRDWMEDQVVYLREMSVENPERLALVRGPQPRPSNNQRGEGAVPDREHGALVAPGRLRSARTTAWPHRPPHWRAAGTCQVRVE